MDNTDLLDFQLFFELNLDILCVNNAKGEFETINKSFENALGYTLEEIKQLTAADLVHPEDLMPSALALSKAKEGAKLIHFTNRIKHKNGSFRTIEWKNYPIDGLIYATGRDITELKAKEEEIIKNKMRLNAIIENDSSFICRIDINNAFTYANENYLKTFLPDYTKETIIGASAQELSAKKEIEVFGADPRECIKNIGKAYQIETKERLPTGEYAYTLWDCVCIADSYGNPSELQMVGVDITKKRLTEIQIKEKKALELLEQMTPITKIWEGILFCPITGMLNPERASKIVENVLNKIADTQAKVIILDIIGIPRIDKQAASYLLKLSKATQLMGCSCTMAGISPAVAQTLIDLDIHIEQINTTSNMKDALEKALATIGLSINKLKSLK